MVGRTSASSVESAATKRTLSHPTRPERRMAKRAAHVTEAELAVLDVLWDRGPTSAREITERLYPRGQPADVATVQKLLQRLEEKRFVCRDRRERVHQFSAAMARKSSPDSSFRVWPKNSPAAR